MAKIAAADIDFASLEPVVHYTGDQAPGDVPQRDLNPADLAYIHRVRALQASSGDPVAPARPMDVAAVANDLLEYPGFSARAVPAAAPRKPAKKPAAKPSAAAPIAVPIESPAAPAGPAEEN